MLEKRPIKCVSANLSKIFYVILCLEKESISIQDYFSWMGHVEACRSFKFERRKKWRKGWTFEKLFDRYGVIGENYYSCWMTPGGITENRRGAEQYCRVLLRSIYMNLDLRFFWRHKIKFDIVSRHIKLRLQL